MATSALSKLDVESMSLAELRKADKAFWAEEERREAKRKKILAKHAEEATSRVEEALSGLHPKQRAFVESDHKRKAACCGRRSGKTLGVGRMLLIASENNPQGDREEPTVIGYVAPTKNQAKRLMWGRLQNLATKLGIPMKFNSTELIAEHINGSQIWILGADNARDIERLRGFAFVLVVIDEAQAIGAHLKYMVEEIIDPALEDLDGTLALTGTPNASCSGLFHDICNTDEFSEAWEVHHWTVLDNSKFPRWSGNSGWRKMAEAHLEAKRRKWNWTEDSPSYVREWLGKWVKDFSKLMYKYDPARNGYGGLLPEGFDWRYIVGVDLGFDDPFAIVVIAYSVDLPDVYQVYEYKDSGMIPSQWAEKVDEVRKLYQTDYVVVDSGGLGRAIIEEWRARYSIPCKPASKSNKFEYAALLNDDLQRRRAHVLEGGLLATEMGALQLFDNSQRVGSSFKSVGKPMEDPRYHNHCCDAFLYAWRDALHWLHRPPEEKVPEKPEVRLKREVREKAEPKKSRFVSQRELRRKVAGWNSQQEQQRSQWWMPCANAA